MLTRYKIYRGGRPPDDPLPDGVRQDTRKHTRHILRPPAEAVLAYLDKPSETAWSRFAGEYRSAVNERFRADRQSFDALAALAAAEDVYLGCSCPTARNPDVMKCHTVLALQFMMRHYPGVEVVLPG